MKALTYTCNGRFDNLTTIPDGALTATQTATSSLKKNKAQSPTHSNQVYSRFTRHR